MLFIYTKIIISIKLISVIKVIREVTSLGLKEAKEMADSAPGNVKESVSKEEAEELKTKLEEAKLTENNHLNGTGFYSYG